MISEIGVLISDIKIWNDAVVVAWVCEGSVCDTWSITKNSATFAVVGEEEDMLAAIRAVPLTDLDAEDSPIVSY